MEKHIRILQITNSWRCKFNVNKPADFKGHSLSVSDIIAINGVEYYCNNIGFKELTEDFEITFAS